MIKNETFSGTIESIMPPPLGLNTEGLDKAILIQEKLEEFCKKHNIDKVSIRVRDLKCVITLIKNEE